MARPKGHVQSTMGNHLDWKCPNSCSCMPTIRLQWIFLAQNDEEQMGRRRVFAPNNSSCNDSCFLNRQETGHHWQPKLKGQEMDTIGNHPLIENSPFPPHICQQLGINASFWPKMMRNEWGGGGFSHPTIAAINNCFSLTREEDWCDINSATIFLAMALSTKLRYVH